jgi:hypothetical protein
VIRKKARGRGRAEEMEGRYNGVADVVRIRLRFCGAVESRVQ